MFESMCSEVLLSGLLYINNKTIDRMDHNDVHIQYSAVSYVVPDELSLLTKQCNNEIVIKKIDNMKDYIAFTN